MTSTKIQFPQPGEPLYILLALALTARFIGQQVGQELAKNEQFCGLVERNKDAVIDGKTIDRFWQALAEMCPDEMANIPSHGDYAVLAAYAGGLAERLQPTAMFQGTIVTGKVDPDCKRLRLIIGGAA
jgi:hypothetical protein